MRLTMLKHLKGAARLEYPSGRKVVIIPAPGRKGKYTARVPSEDGLETHKLDIEAPDIKQAAVKTAARVQTEKLLA